MFTWTTAARARRQVLLSFLNIIYFTEKGALKKYQYDIYIYIYINKFHLLLAPHTLFNRLLSENKTSIKKLLAQLRPTLEELGLSLLLHVNRSSSKVDTR
jgi:hypothetical protein